MASPFDNMPNELVSLLFSLMDRLELDACSKTCKRFYEIINGTNALKDCLFTFYGIENYISTPRFINVKMTIKKPRMRFATEFEFRFSNR